MPLPEASSKCDAQKQKAPQIIDLQGFYCIELLGSSQRGIIPTQWLLVV